MRTLDQTEQRKIGTGQALNNQTKSVNVSQKAAVAAVMDLVIRSGVMVASQSASIDGTPRAVKVARVVWRGGKADFRENILTVLS